MFNQICPKPILEFIKRAVNVVVKLFNIPTTIIKNLMERLSHAPLSY